MHVGPMKCMVGLSATVAVNSWERGNSGMWTSSVNLSRVIIFSINEPISFNHSTRSWGRSSFSYSVHSHITWYCTGKVEVQCDDFRGCHKFLALLFKQLNVGTRRRQGISLPWWLTLSDIFMVSQLFYTVLLLAAA